MERYTKKEVNNQKQGKTGAKVKQVIGPAVAGDTSGNSTKSGGIFRATKGKGK
jgi:hypothetical protein